MSGRPQWLSAASVHAVRTHRQRPVHEPSRGWSFLPSPRTNEPNNIHCSYNDNDSTVIYDHVLFYIMTVGRSRVTVWSRPEEIQLSARRVSGVPAWSSMRRGVTAERLVRRSMSWVAVHWVLHDERPACWSGHTHSPNPAHSHHSLSSHHSANRLGVVVKNCVIIPNNFKILSERLYVCLSDHAQHISMRSWWIMESCQARRHSSSLGPRMDSPKWTKFLISK